MFFFKVKKPLRQCGEWYEFLSSQNKIYYYNSITEKTQWDKPNEWTLDEYVHKLNVR